MLSTNLETSLFPVSLVLWLTKMHAFVCLVMCGVWPKLVSLFIAWKWKAVQSYNLRQSNLFSAICHSQSTALLKEPPHVVLKNNFCGLLVPLSNNPTYSLMPSYLVLNLETPFWRDTWRTNQFITTCITFLSGGQRGGPAPTFGSCENKCIFN